MITPLPGGGHATETDGNRRFSGVIGDNFPSPAVRRLLSLLGHDCCLDRNAAVALFDYFARQLDSVGEVATDRTVIVEVFADAIGEPRMVVHSPFGGRVNRAWSVVLAGALRDRYGVEAQTTASDDGILIRFTSAEDAPPTDLLTSVTSQEARERLIGDLPNSATFVAQFRMNAARALLLPRESAGKRTPLWLSRLRAKDLLQAVQGFGDFPIVLETYRDCLRDVMDLDGLVDLIDGIGRGEIDVVVHEADTPSPVAAGLDFVFAMQYVYEYDQPRGERQLSALTLNRELLADLLRDGTLAGMLKPQAVAEVASHAGHLSTNERARDEEELALILYELGDLSDDEARARCAGEADAWMLSLAKQGRAVRRELGGGPRWIHAERLSEYEQLAIDPGPVLRRYLTHAGPTEPAELSTRYGLAAEAVDSALSALGPDVVSGRFEPDGPEQWIDRRNLEQIHRRTLSLLRREIRPASIYAYADFLRRWQGIGDAEGQAQPLGSSSVELPAGGSRLDAVLAQLRGMAAPGAIWERDVLPSRIPGFTHSALAERCHSGEVMWTAEGGRDPRRARVRFFFRGEGGLFLDRQPSDETLASLGDDARAVFEFLREEGAGLLADVAEGAGLERAAAQAALVELVLAGLVTNDSLDALATILGYEPPLDQERPVSALETELEARLTALRPGRLPNRSHHRMREARRHAREVVESRERSRRAAWVGRWSLVHRTSLLGRSIPDEDRALRQARLLLHRWGVVAKTCLERESPVLDWQSAYQILSRLEVRGEVRRGYFVEGLSGIQFALPGAVERLRESASRREGAIPGSDVGDTDELSLVVLGAADPAQLFGTDAYGGPLRFQRVSTSAVAAWNGEPVVVMEDGGSSASAVMDHPMLIPGLRAAARWWRSRSGGRVRVERWQGESIQTTSQTVSRPLREAGFVDDYGAMLWVG